MHALLDPIDVLVIGGGPAGATAATYLAQGGARVALAEKELEPQFKIGESLLPDANKVLREMGVWPKIAAAGFVEKYGAQFTDGARRHTVRNVFAEGMIPGLEQTYQVTRSVFDPLLRSHAGRNGAKIYSGCHTSQIKQLREGWQYTLTGRDGTVVTGTASYLIDASGRAAVLARELGIPRQRLPYPSRSATFTHFRNFPRPEGKVAGDIIITRTPHGWFWTIPLTDDITSVGVVTGSGQQPPADPAAKAQWFQGMTAHAPWLAAAMREATPLQAYSTVADYSFTTEKLAGERWLLTGDAAAFVDPIFSSGVSLALKSGRQAAETVLVALAAHRPLLASEQRRYGRELRRRIRIMQELIEIFYDDRGWDVFMSDDPPFKLPAAVNAIVGGASELPWAVKWRYQLFRVVCRLNRRFAFVQPRAEPTSLAA